MNWYHFLTNSAKQTIIYLKLCLENVAYQRVEGRQLFGWWSPLLTPMDMPPAIPDQTSLNNDRYRGTHNYY